jgi:hypothetical protein
MATETRNAGANVFVLLATHPLLFYPLRYVDDSLSYTLSAPLMLRRLLVDVMYPLHFALTTSWSPALSALVERFSPPLDAVFAALLRTSKFANAGTMLPVMVRTAFSDIRRNSASEQPLKILALIYFLFCNTVPMRLLTLAERQEADLALPPSPSPLPMLATHVPASVQRFSTMLDDLYEELVSAPDPFTLCFTTILQLRIIWHDSQNVADHTPVDPVGAMVAEQQEFATRRELISRRASRTLLLFLVFLILGLLAFFKNFS